MEYRDTKALKEWTLTRTALTPVVNSQCSSGRTLVDCTADIPSSGSFVAVTVVVILLVNLTILGMSLPIVHQLPILLTVT
jgi:hypothetical protein